MIDSHCPIDRFPNACPCCGYATLDERCGWEICRICWWEDDGQDNHNATLVAGGPNSHVSLARARLNFITSGIFQPRRDDLREAQNSPEGVERLRIFAFLADKQTLTEQGTDWSVSVAQLDDDSTASYFDSGKWVRYRRRYLDSALLDGIIDTVEWDEKLEQWTYRIRDSEGRPVNKTFTAADFEQGASENVE
ncbi:hypothetical protein LOC67_17075 [Stieleria sp. JC731]|uniref:CPCC family cysteine-rich protein n=1 Tax=Pirellulaceae TaxID=2691357 RepID=UPI001E39C34A|nr:CPCC family cysteine-rich protein [Stieleria sp. JC731]MCC9602269.1 hypothetical protein [Stieleria sp. JC731]